MEGAGDAAQSLQPRTSTGRIDVSRAPDCERTLAAGDLVCFPAGPAGAHKLMNRSDAPARTLMFSSARVPAVSAYPDSEKIGIWPGNEADELIFFRGTAVPY